MLHGRQPPRWPSVMLTNWIHALPTWNQHWPCMTHRLEQKWWCVISKAKPQKASKLAPWSSGSPTPHSAICHAVRVLKQHVERPHRQGLTCQSREAPWKQIPSPSQAFKIIADLIRNWLQPHERTRARITHLSHSQIPDAQKPGEIRNYCHCFKPLHFEGDLLHSRSSWNTHIYTLPNTDYPEKDLTPTGKVLSKVSALPAEYSVKQIKDFLLTVFKVSKIKHGDTLHIN